MGRRIVLSSLLLLLLLLVASVVASTDEIHKRKKPSVCVDFKTCTDKCQCVKDEQKLNLRNPGIVHGANTRSTIQDGHSYIESNKYCRQYSELLLLYPIDGACWLIRSLIAIANTIVLLIRAIGSRYRCRCRMQ
jgi:hypothetical protein